jgi:hypothetical protein
MAKTIKRVDISGFPGPYENACQTMLNRFLEWSKDKTFNELYSTQKDKKGLRKDVEEEFSKLVEDIEPSGAMWGGTLSHFAYIKKDGYESWLKLGEEQKRIIEWNPEDAIHFDSTEAAFEAGKKLGETL